MSRAVHFHDRAAQRRVAVLVGFFCAALAACDATPPDGLREAIEARVAAARPAVVCVAYAEIGTGAGLHVDPDRVLHAASTMKVAVLVELYRQAAAGQIDLDAPIAVENRFHSALDGSEFALDPADDADPELYAHAGRTVPARDLARRMVVRSSNLATNVLLQRIGVESVQRGLERLGLRDMKVVRGVQDLKAFEAGLSNVVTVRDLAGLLTHVAGRGRAREPFGRAMLDVLLAQELEGMIPAGLPPGTRVAHKTGEIEGLVHDAAIVYDGERPAYVLVILTQGFADPKEALATGAAIAAEIHRRR